MNSSLKILKFFSPYFHAKKTGFFLFGHNVIQNKPINSDVQSLCLEMDQLEIIVKVLSNLGFVFLSMEESMKIVFSGKKFNRPWVHLTFDDGYKNNYTLLYPFLTAKGIPFTIFVSTCNIIENKKFDNFTISCVLSHSDKKNELHLILNDFNIPQDLHQNLGVIKSRYKSFPTIQKKIFLSKLNQLLTAEEWEKYNKMYDSEEVLSVDELKILSSDSLVHIGSHGHNHYILSTLSDNEINQEQLLSRNIIKEITGKYPITYCYPNGKNKDLPDNIDLLSKSNNYQIGFTTIHKKISTNEDFFKIPRFPLSVNYLPILIPKLL